MTEPTKSQRKVLEFCRQGKTNTQIAAHLATSADGARGHITKLMARGLIISDGKRPATYRAVIGEHQ